MKIDNLDNIIFLGFVGLNLIVGLATGSKVKTIKDYALGGRNFSNIALVATIVATWVSGSGFFITVSKTYSGGLYYLIASSAITLQFILMAYFLIPKMEKFLGKTSIAEAMGEIYGNEVRIIMAIAGSIGACGLIAVQFKVFGNVFSYFYGIDSKEAVIIASVVVTTYSALGGIRAVTFTDVLQFFTFTIAIPVIIYLIWRRVGVIDIKSLLSHQQFDYKNVINFRNPEFWEMILLLLYFTIPPMAPTFTQRISIGRDIKQVKFAFICSAFILLFIKLAIAFIPIMIYSFNPNLEPNNLVSYMIDEFASPGFKGLLIIAVVSMAMSTADSYINSSSVIFANDFCKPIGLFKNHTLLVSKIFAFSLGGGALFLALKTQDMLNMLLTGNSFYFPIATPPTVLTILGFKTNSTPILIGMFAGFITTFLWHYLKIKMDGIVIAMFINLIFLLASHYLLKKNITIKKNMVFY